MKKTLWRLSAVLLTLGAAIAAAFSVSAFTAEAVEKANEQLPAQAAQLSSEAFTRSEYDFNAGWKFKFDAGGDYGASVDDTSWESVTLPHTWNAADGTNGGYDYKRGKGMYRKSAVIPASFAGKRIFIEFGGVNVVSSLYIDGSLVPFVYEDGRTSDIHNGGYTKFRFDITDKVTAGSTHTFAVCADNTKYQWAAPLEGDFTFYGGIYRDVKLIAVPDVHIDLLDNGSEGLYVTALKKSDTENTGIWELTVKATLVNDGAQPKTVDISTLVREPEAFDALSTVPETLTPFDESAMTGTAVLADDTSEITLAAGERYVFTKTYEVTDPKLWNGRTSPFRYDVNVSLAYGGETLDAVSDKIGFRTFSVDPEKGFFLNGVSYPLRGVSKHQDLDGVGNAITTAMQDTDFGILYEIGANTVRLAHYPYVDYFYDLCDQYGLVVWAEVPFITDIGGSGEYGEFDEDRTKFVGTVKDQLVELIRSQYNHPSIVFWSMQNEVDRYYYSVMRELMEKEIYPLTKKEDPNRIATFATYHEQGFDWKADVVGLNFYPAWYGYETYQFTTVLQDYHKRYPGLSLGISEYGAGGSEIQHEETPTRPEPFGDRFHPEEYQTFVHEEIAKQIYSGDLDFLWATYIWNLFDFGSDKRAEGSRSGINDKGLVSYDRTVKKDSFYVYKALWSDEAFVHLQRKRFTVRDTDKITVKASSNCESLSLTVNGKAFGETLANDGFGQFSWTKVPLELGENTVVLTGTKDGKTYTETVVWTRTKSKNTGISSTVLTVDASQKTIVLRTAFTADKVADYIRTDDEKAVLSVLSADKTTVMTTQAVEPRMYLRVTAEDGETTADYRFLENNIGFGKSVTSGTTSYAALVNGKYDDTVYLDGLSLTKELVIDLQEVYHVGYLKLYPANADCSYALSISRDGKTYAPVTVTSAAAADYTTLSAGDKSARYLKLAITSSSSRLTMSEIEVYGWRFAGSAYAVDETKRIIVTNSAGEQLADSVFLETLDISGNCTYEIVRSSSVFYVSDGDTLKITDDLGKVTFYTICTDADCQNRHSTNVALGKPVTVSDPGQPDRLPFYINDGVIGTTDVDPRWQAASSAYPQTIVIDLEDYYSIDSYELVTFAAIYSDRAYGYKLSGSLDGESYTVLDDRSANTDRSGVHSGTFAAEVRYIKLEITRSTKGTAGVIELSVYGSPADKTVKGLAVKYPKMLLAVGSSETVSLSLSPAFAEKPEDLTFESADANIASVSAAGTVTGKSTGSTTVTVSSASLGLSAKIAVTVSDKHVLSLGRPVQLQNNADQAVDTPLVNVNDGDLSTRWQGESSAASAGAPTYITIDLERLCAVDSLDVSFFSPSSRAHYYEISVSTDGESFTQVVDNLQNSRYNVTTFSHTLTQSVMARYVRLGITGQTAGATPGVYELTVYGEPAANEVEALTFDKEYLYLGVGDVETLAYRVEPAGADGAALIWKSSNENAATVSRGVVTAVGIGGTQITAYTADGTLLASIDVFVERLRNISVGKKVIDYDDYGIELEAGTNYKNTVENLTDGLIPSSNFNFPRWHVQDRDTHYAVIDLEGVYAVEEIDLYFFYYSSRAYGYKLSASLDGETFTVMADRLENNRNGVRTEAFESPVYARYIRLDITAPVSPATSTTGVYEVSVYGKPADFAVETSQKNSIRINGNSGIRFGGFVSAKTLLNADECGFIIARGDLLNAKGLASEEEVKIASVTEEKTDDSFTAATENGLKLVGARNYRKDDFNKLTASDDGSTPFGETYDAQGFWFTGVLVSLENSYTNADDGKTYAHRYNVPFAARAYVKIGSSYYYGSCRTASLAETAQRIKETGGDAYTKNQAYIDNILAQADAILDE